MTLAVERRSTKTLSPRRGLDRLTAALSDLMPKGLYARALIIIIAPIVLLESVIAFVFMERHWQSVTRRLSEATAHDIAAIIEVYRKYPQDAEYSQLTEVARLFGMSLQMLPAGDLPPTQPRPFFDQVLHRTLSSELRKLVEVPFWIDTVGDSSVVEVRASLPNVTVRLTVNRSQVYASNSHIFLLWMVGTSIVLLTVSILFLRNQIRPILRLADAADAFGKGRPVPSEFRARGAREVRQAAYAFLEMRDRIERHVEQRTTMLAGVSHDLRTILTRFRLQLALLGEGPEQDGMRSDIDEMQLMLEDYLAFTRGDGGEESRPTDVRAMLEEIRSAAERAELPIELRLREGVLRTVEPLYLKRQAFKRAVGNLVTNAARFGDTVVLTASRDKRWLRVEIDDDGPGIPADKREEVFRPFFRLDTARNQDQGNSGLGLAIARDIARSHGGDVWLEESTLGGVRAVIRIPI
jgi:two-component system osmolarity sensor histidine kinase EnvZ